MAADSAWSMRRATCSVSKGRRPTPRHAPRMSTMPKKILITGGAGFIGSHAADLFLAEGWDVSVVDDLSSGKRENLPAKARFHEINVTSPDFARIVREGKFDVVAHL